jgi:DNA (cytosine-5)-methyltransferase 1
MSEKHQLELEKIYEQAIELLKENNNIAIPSPDLPKKIVEHIDLITDNVEYVLGINNVLITSLTEKIVNPNQDIRLHQAKMDGGYSGRTLDTKYIAPFLKSKGLRSMVESGWLTRSLEQGYPYNLDYRGAIKNKGVKKAFLEIIDFIQTKDGNPRHCLLYYLQNLILFREREKIEIEPLADSSKLSISDICHLLEDHFEQSNSYGKSKLPVIAIYSIYECLIKELKRFENKTLVPLGHHTSADLRSKAIGDVQVNDENEQPFEGVEIKYKKQITHQLVNDAYQKLKIHPVNRYYILSTEDITDEEMPEIQYEVNRIAEEHGCQMIPNGLMNSIKYYLRLIENPDEFIEKYTSNIVVDTELKIEHKEVWKHLLAEIRKSKKTNV